MKTLSRRTIGTKKDKLRRNFTNAYTHKKTQIKTKKGSYCVNAAATAKKKTRRATKNLKEN